MPKINGGIDDRQKRKHRGISQLHHSLPLIPPCLFFPSRSSVCSGAAAHCGQTGLRLLSSTCQLNDCNYFLRLRATHACFIPTSTSTICLYGKAWHTLWRDEKKKNYTQLSILFLSIPFYWSLLGPPEPRILYWGAPLFYGAGEILLFRA